MKYLIQCCCMLFLSTVAFAQKAPRTLIYKVTSDYSTDSRIDQRTLYFKAEYIEQTKQRTVVDFTLLRFKIKSAYADESYVPEIFDTDSLDASAFYGYSFYYYAPLIGKKCTVVSKDSTVAYLGQNADSLRIALTRAKKLNDNTRDYLLQNDSGFLGTVKFILHPKPGPEVKLEELPLTSVSGHFDQAYAFMLWDMMEQEKVAREDSIGTRAFLNANNPIYGKRDSYRILRLRMLQHISWKEYHHELTAMPIYLLEGQSSDLFNKISGMDDRLLIPTDSVVKIIGLMNNYFRNSFFKDVFPQSIFYGLHPKEDIYKKAYAADTLVTNKLLVSAIPHIKNLVGPMLLMRKALASTDTAMISKYAQELDNCTTDDIIYGSLPRYRIMVENHMQKNGLKSAAVAYRDHTIQLVKAFNDSIAATGTKNEYQKQVSINKAMLADCWYRKYQDTYATDSSKAFEYLLKTITDGPSSKTEVQRSFYDIFMTEGKGEYMEEVISLAEKTGRKDVALGMLVKQLGMDNNKLEVLQQFYEKNYPGQLFSEFITKELVARWKTAPDFDLQGTGNKYYKLSDYKGKWLLLDFWGSWCQPCCADLPHLNALALQLEQDNNGAAVLAIACHESAVTSEKYLQSKGYGLSSAFSGDGTAIGFGVTGYPFKVLISPDGKMLPLQYGEDYASILKKYMAAGTGQANKTSPDLQTKSVRD
ncbi:TlpA disulfide reductase family protein [Chitinophaga sp. Cy-1792]|uniref:TlpA family protein disulfide reductase n=1 Tax=Chitinophaga sp. Cy-1792 TaxID=2608339 RepID=UPI001422C430|nr:TlpA disulfide reductase family protein [Chitinophaga sp. Cy-1792]NIG51943.1 TlpA family protein disulfide reductase [Chitinophaga sp. Cy-1792]